MAQQVPDWIRAVSGAYYAGVAAAAVLLALWLLAGTIVAYRAHRAGKSRTVLNFILGAYIFTGYTGYLAVVDPIAVWFMKRVAIVEAFVTDPWWVRNGIPAGLTLICVAAFDYAIR